MVQIATLPLMLKQLRLSSIARHWQAFLGKAERNGWDSAQYLTALCEQELAERYSRRIARYGKESHLPIGKSLASFDFAQVPGLAREQIEALEAGQKDIQKQLGEIKRLLQQQQQKAPKRSGPQVKDVVFNVGRNEIKGASDAKLTLIEFTDYQ